MLDIYLKFIDSFAALKIQEKSDVIQNYWPEILKSNLVTK